MAEVHQYGANRANGALNVKRDVLMPLSKRSVCCEDATKVGIFALPHPDSDQQEGRRLDPRCNFPQSRCRRTVRPVAVDCPELPADQDKTL